MMKKALVLAGGFPQIALIEELHNRGYYVILADYNDNPVAKKYCDKYYKASTLDVDTIKKIAIDEAVNFVITVCTDQALLTVAKVSEELGLPCYIDYQTGLNVTNKQYMKDVFVRNDIPTAKHLILDELYEDKISGLTYPLIVKPVDCNSSKGVIKVYDYNELKKAFKNAKELSRTNTAIIEEFIEGKELTVDAYVDNNKATVLSISVSQKIKNDEKFVIFRTFNPANVSDDLKNKISNTVQKIATSFGLKNTPMLIQMLSNGTNAYVIEFSARTGGGVKHLLIKEVSGFDVIGAVVDLTEGLLPKVSEYNRKNKYLINEFIYCNPGEFDHLYGFEEMKKQDVISNYYLFKEKGALLGGINNSGDRIAGFTIVGNSIEELLKKHQLANNNVKVVDINNNDIMKHELLIDFSVEDF